MQYTYFKEFYYFWAIIRKASSCSGSHCGGIWSTFYKARNLFMSTVWYSSISSIVMCVVPLFLFQYDFRSRGSLFGSSYWERKRWFHLSRSLYTSLHLYPSHSMLRLIWFCADKLLSKMSAWQHRLPSIATAVRTLCPLSPQPSSIRFIVFVASPSSASSCEKTGCGKGGLCDNSWMWETDNVESAVERLEKLLLSGKLWAWLIHC